MLAQDARMCCVDILPIYSRYINKMVPRLTKPSADFIFQEVLRLATEDLQETARKALSYTNLGLAIPDTDEHAIQQSIVTELAFGAYITLKELGLIFSVANESYYPFYMSYTNYSTAFFMLDIPDMSLALNKVAETAFGCLVEH